MKFILILRGLDILIMLSGYGLYIVNGENELIYVNLFKDIYKFLSDMKIIVRLILGKNDIWYLWCVFWFFLFGDFLIGMWKYGKDGKEKNLWMGKVVCYNFLGELK